MRGKQNKTDVWDWKREGVAGENRGLRTLTEMTEQFLHHQFVYLIYHKTH